MVRWNYLDLSWRLLLVFGCFNILFAILIPVLSHVLFPKPFIFLSEDQQFTNVQWTDILLLNQKLAFWIVLLADTGRGTMMGYGVLIIYLALKGLRTGSRWALSTVFISGLLSGIYSWVPMVLFLRQGLYNGFSGVSLGIWTTILLYAPWVLGIIFGRLGLRPGERPLSES